MAKHSKHRSPPCDCLNKVADLGSGRQSGSCTQCDDQYLNGLCAYVAHFECNYYTQNATREKIAEPCLVLRKDCILGCTYSSRWACPGNNPTNDAPVLRWANCEALGALGQRCAGCETIACITGAITSAELYSLCGRGGTLIDATHDLYLYENMTFTLAYYGAQVPKDCDLGLQDGCLPDDFNQVWPDSCMWSGYAVDSDGDTRFDIPIFMDYYNGGWRMRIYSRVNELLESNGPCGPPVSINDLVGYFLVVVIDLPYFTCDPSTWTDFTHDYSVTFDDGTVSASISIADWAVTSGCPTPAVIEMAACTWAQAGCEGPDTCDQSEEPTGSEDEFYDSIDQCYTKWRMTITSPNTATIELTTREGFFAIYTCANFNCYERSTFKMAIGAYDEYTNPTGVYSPEVIGLPLCLCVSPLSYAAGGCVNSGFEACCDSGGPSLSVQMTVFNCQDELVFEGWMPFYRGIALPCGVTDMTGDECLYFGAYVAVDAGCADWGGSLFIYMACSSNLNGAYPCKTGIGVDSKYEFVVYCLNNNTGCWEEQVAYCQDYSCTCIGPAPPMLYITKPCCCAYCGCIPLTDLTLEVTSGTDDCSCATGEVFTLEYQGETAGTHEWHAYTVDHLCRNDPFETSPAFIMTCVDGVPDLSQIRCSASSATLISVSCDPFVITFEASAGQLAGCCDPMASGAGPETITFSVT